MAKDRKTNNTSKNVFKVAGSRSLKAKNKAKSVSTQLKKLNEVNKRKLDEVDKQLNSLQEEVRQQSSKKNDKLNKDTSKLSSNERANDFEECEKKSAEALEKLNEMVM